MIKSHVLYRLSYGLQVQTRTMSHLRHETDEYGQVVAVPRVCRGGAPPGQEAGTVAQD